MFFAVVFRIQVLIAQYQNAFKEFGIMNVVVLRRVAKVVFGVQMVVIVRPPIFVRAHLNGVVMIAIHPCALRLPIPKLCGI
jgi:hypothetical protein|tara:strand:+ start:9982 stop:10224 length:243 start_codon:yes stop_codon:yes gene_type:complete